ncbi:hypothetical protein V8F33_003686 [Rhypophila sp. PSN 637]
MAPYATGSSPAQAIGSQVLIPEPVNKPCAAAPLGRTINKRNWLSGDVINDLFARVTSFLPNWTTVNSMVVTGPKRDRSKWKARFQKVQDLQILLPIHTGGNHWSMVHLDCEERVAVFVESRRRNQSLLSAKTLVEDFIPRFLPDSHQPSEGEELWETWTKSALPCVQQSNTWDCGVFTIAAAFRSICDFDLESPLDTVTVRLWLKKATSPDLKLTDLVDKDIGQAQAKILSQLLKKPESSDFDEETVDTPMSFWEEIEWIYEQRKFVAARKVCGSAVRDDVNELAWVAEMNAHTMLEGLTSLLKDMEAKINTFHEINEWLETLCSRVPTDQELPAQQRKKIDESKRWAEDQREEIWTSIALCEELQGSYQQRAEMIQGAIDLWEEVGRMFPDSDESVGTIEGEDECEDEPMITGTTKNEDEPESIQTSEGSQVDVISLIYDDEDGEDDED